ncbi:hypothetical protein [Brevibacillus reuszeri]|uniref:hypothetical protein n=1 Tax=Brevibacillus reuszeri TaxID=54915 RepID=UPI000CCBFF7B|nr:hypothetical protein [Brevibacillus reuszeri]
MDKKSKQIEALNKRMEKAEDYTPILIKQSWFQVIAIAAAVPLLTMMLIQLGAMDLKTQALPNFLLVNGFLSLLVILLIASFDFLRFVCHLLFTSKKD